MADIRREAALLQAKLARQKLQAGLTDRERAAAAKAGLLEIPPERQAEIAALEQKGRDQIALASAGTGEALATKFLEGVPFAGTYVDEAAGLIGGPQVAERVRAISGAMDREHPYLSAGAQLAGGVVSTVPAAVALAPGVAAAAPAGIGTRAALGFGAGGAVGAVEGAVSGYGRGTDAESRADAARTGAMLGGAFGAGLGAAAPVAAAGIEALVTRLKGKDVAQIAGALGISTPAAKVIKAQIEADDFAGIARELQRAGPQAMLADAGGSLGKLLDDAMASGGAATRIGRDAVNARAAQGQRKLVNLMDGILGKPVGAREAQRDIATGTAAARQRAYDRAYAQPIDYSTGGKGDDILAVLERVPDRTMQAAVREANEAMQAEGIRNKQIMASIAPDGRVTFTQMPDVRQVDEIKKALFSVADKETDPVTGKISAAGLRAKKLGRELAAKIGDAVPDYKLATKLGGDKLQMEEAAKLGRKLFKPGTSREEVADLVATKLSREAKAELKRAMRSQIEDTMANAQRTIGGGSETEVQEAMKAVKMLSSRAAREKAEMVLGHQSARVLFDQLDEVGKHLELRVMTARGSQTAGRIAGKAAIDDALAPGVAGRVARGEPVSAAKEVVRVLTGRTIDYDRAQQQKLYAELARALTESRGLDALKALQVVTQAIQGQPVKDADAEMVARVLTTAGVLAGYQQSKLLQ